MRARDGWIAGASTADQLAVRRHNLAVVMDHLRLSGPMSRARIAAETGLNKATVSSLVAELGERGLVAEGETERGAVGRPGLVIELDTTVHVSLGAEISVDYLSVLAMNLRGDAVAERRIALDASRLSPEEILARLAELIRDVLGDLADGTTVVGLTVAIPGLVESVSGIVHAAPNLGWREVRVADLLHELLDDPGIAILLDNEANLAALAELDLRGTDAPDEFILLMGGVGIGGGLVTAGQLLRGACGFAGEVGHLQVTPSGETCRCGRRGCWETVIGLHALLALAAGADDVVRDPSVDLDERLGELRARAERGDRRTLDAIATITAALVSGAGTLLNIFNPRLLVLGGYFAVLSPWIEPGLREALHREVFAPKSGGCRIEFSGLGYSAAVRGGAVQAASAVFDNPSAFPLTPLVRTVQEVGPA
ncbi:ROK family transcriptional regulator [Nocardioides terrigena]|uniref:ROK family transcriptional regulator n=1 Tax=Nocardioides terrigena TaxID=424797 RepID=UPI000D2FEF46|nr:ROK family transcriptional regulator [Nocardioides terrigena]